MPHGMARHAMISLSNSVVTFGGYDGSNYLDTIYEMTCNFNTCSWTKKAQTLNDPRHDMVAIRIPNDAANCWNPIKYIC